MAQKETHAEQAAEFSLLNLAPAEFAANLGKLPSIGEQMLVVFGRPAVERLRHQELVDGH